MVWIGCRAAAGQVDERQFSADVAALSAQPTRAPGTAGYAAAGAYIRQQIARLPAGAVVAREQPFPILTAVTEQASLTVPGRDPAGVWPLVPAAGVRVNATPAEGLTGRLVYCGDGRLAAMTPATLTGQIAVLEAAAGERWTTAVNLGARAVILLGSAEVTNVDLRPHDLPVPVNCPRFYLPPGPLADDVRHGRLGQAAATLKVAVTWRPGTGTNFVVLVRPTDARTTAAALAITVPYDSSSLVPDLAPAASQAVQAACGLAMLREWAARPPTRPVVVCFTGGDSTAFQASRQLFMAMSDPPATWAAERDEVAAHVADLTAQLARARATLARPAGINPTADKSLVDRLAKIVELLELSAQDKLFELRDVRPDQETPGLRAERQALEARRATLSRAAYAFRQRPADLATADLAPVAADVLARAVDTLAGSADTGGGLIGDARDRLALLDQRADLYRWLASAEHRDPDPPLVDAADHYLIELLVGLDLTDRGYRAGPITFGRFCRTSTVADVQHYAEWFTTLATDNPGWFRDLNGTVDMAPLATALSAVSWMPGTQAIPSEMGQAFGIPSLSFITLDDARPYRDTPADTPDKLRLRSVIDQLAAVRAVIVHAWDDPAFTTPTEHKSRHVTVTGQTVSLSPGRPVPDLPRGGFLATYFHVTRDDLRIPAVRDEPYTIGVRRGEAVACDADGHYRFEALWRLAGDPQEVAVNAFQVRPGTGAVTATTDLGSQAGDVGIYANYHDRDPDPVRSLVFNCGEFALTGLYDPRYLQDLTDVLPLDARRNADPQRYNLLLQRQLMAGYVEPGTPLSLLLRYGRVGNRLVLVNLPDVATLDQTAAADTAGRGYTSDQLDHLGLTALATARDFWRVDDLRLAKYRRAGVSSDLLDGLHRQAGKQIDDATKLAADPAADAGRVVTDANGAWANEARVYAAAQDMANDVIHAAIFLLLLLVPFSFAMERLLIGTPNVYKQIGGACGIFGLMTAALWSFHPAFQISASPLIIVLAFAIIVMSLVVIGVVYQKFDSELKRLRSGRAGTGGTASAGAEGPSLARASVLVSAVVLGIANMRRRRFRTVLTSTTVVLVTFAVLCFTSASRYLDTRTVPTGVPTRYPGVMLRQRGFRPMTAQLVDQVDGRVGRPQADGRPAVVVREPGRPAGPGPRAAEPDGHRRLAGVARAVPRRVAGVGRGRRDRPRKIRPAGSRRRRPGDLSERDDGPAAGREGGGYGRRGRVRPAGRRRVRRRHVRPAGEPAQRRIDGPAEVHPGRGRRERPPAGRGLGRRPVARRRRGRVGRGVRPPAGQPVRRRPRRPVPAAAERPACRPSPCGPTPTTRPSRPWPTRSAGGSPWPSTPASPTACRWSSRPTCRG